MRDDHRQAPGTSADACRVHRYIAKPERCSWTWGAQPPRPHRSAPRQPDRVFGEGSEHGTRAALAPHAEHIARSEGPAANALGEASSQNVAPTHPWPLPGGELMFIGRGMLTELRSFPLLSR